MFLEQKQLHAVVVYIICVPLYTEILYTTTAPEIRGMPNIIGNPRQSRIPLGTLVVYTAAARKAATATAGFSAEADQ